MKLYICGGECLKEQLNEQVSISFNEALCDGQVTYPLFDETFNKLRANVHNVSEELYYNYTVKPLLDITMYDDVELVFGRDMFCMMNMVGLLTYFEQINFPGNITLRLVDELKMDVIDTYEIKLGIYTEMYKTVLINHKRYQGKCVFELECGLETYLQLQSEANEIVEYIEEHLDDEDLLKVLLLRYSDYGLGDTQYLKMIENVKKRRGAY